MKSPDRGAGATMKRNTLYLLGFLAFISWLLVTYFLFLQKPNSQNSKLAADQAERNRLLSAKVDALDLQLKEQLKSNSLLLSKLVKIRGEGREDVRVHAVLDLLEDPGLEVADVLRREKILLDDLKAKEKKSETSEHSRDSPVVQKMLQPIESRHNEPVEGGYNRQPVIKEVQPGIEQSKDLEEEEEEDEEEGNEDRKDEEEEDNTGARTSADDANEDIGVEEKDISGAGDHNVIPLLLFSCNRPTVNRALDLLLTYRPNKEQFPIIVTQDCGHKDTQAVIESYGDQIIYIQQPDLSEPVIPPKEKKFKGYFKIARHYGWALNKTFVDMGFDQVIVVEDDLEISPDFFEYFSATLPLLKQDKSLWCVSAWNDNGKAGLINETAPELLYRTDFFGGLGWMLTKELWSELMVKWPRSYWDDWMREPAQRKGRSCIRPEVSRTKTFGKVGVSNGLFYEKHLKYIVLNTKFVPFTVLDLSFLGKERYDEGWVAEVYRTPLVSLEDLKAGRVSGKSNKAVRLAYHTREAYKRSAKALGIMEDFKSGVPRTAYRGIVSFMHSGVRVFLAPNVNWQGYDPKWA